MPNKKQNDLSKEIKRLMVGVLIVSLFAGIIAGGISGIIFSHYGSDYIRKIAFSNKNEKKIEKKLARNIKVEQLQEESATISAVKKVSPAVVSIIISKDLSKYYNSTGPDIFPFDDFFEFEFPPLISPKFGEKQKVGSGTGFIVDAEKGLILTNKHVVSDPDAEYSVIINSGNRYGAEVLALDPINDLAVIKIQADEKLSEAEFGNSDNLQIGQSAIAIGFALGEYQNSVTKGIISGIGRSVIAGDSSGKTEPLEDIIQTDAAVNPGNSGGPLIDLRGKVIGVNTAIDREGQSVSFAIPSNEAKFVFESVREHNKIIRAFLGVRYILLNQAIAAANNLDVDYGALIIRGESAADLAIIPGSPADKAGLVENDIILEIENEKIRNIVAIVAFMHELR
ncbi:trypsin-like peptidase domain-containing protein, partial [Candidatus Parcubacteria bacterium]|nr:trypsin-like peptidase domain-containing protein [Candidatus Parcubacteria bacterium]